MKSSPSRLATRATRTDDLCHEFMTEFNRQLDYRLTGMCREFVDSGLRLVPADYSVPAARSDLILVGWTRHILTQEVKQFSVRLEQRDICREAIEPLVEMVIVGV